VGGCACRGHRSAAARGGPRLRGSPVTAAWEPPLTETMLALGVKVEEERVLDDLLADLQWVAGAHHDEETVRGGGGSSTLPQGW
jgi:hypothetical protein